VSELCGFLPSTYPLIQISGLAVGGGKTRVPWAKLQEDQGNFILAKYLPNGITLKQFHHIRHDDANALLKHWTGRQAAGEIPFRFKNVDRLGKQDARQNASEGQGQDQVQGSEDRDGEGLAQGNSDGEGQGDAMGNPRGIS
jgi:hypothetical protein